MKAHHALHFSVYQVDLYLCEWCCYLDELLGFYLSNSRRPCIIFSPCIVKSLACRNVKNCTLFPQLVTITRLLYHTIANIPYIYIARNSRFRNKKWNLCRTIYWKLQVHDMTCALFSTNTQANDMLSTSNRIIFSWTFRSVCLSYWKIQFRWSREWKQNQFLALKIFSKKFIRMGCVY